MMSSERRGGKRKLRTRRTQTSQQRPFHVIVFILAKTNVTSVTVAFSLSSTELNYFIFLPSLSRFVLSGIVARLLLFSHPLLFTACSLPIILHFFLWVFSLVVRIDQVTDQQRGSKLYHFFLFNPF